MKFMLKPINLQFFRNLKLKSFPLNSMRKSLLKVKK